MPYDEFESSVLNKKLRKVKKGRIEKKIRVKVIYASKEGRRYAYEEDGKKELRETLFVESKKYPFSGGMNIYGNKIFMIDYKGKPGGIVIENKTLAEMLRQLFLMTWDANKENIK